MKESRYRMMVELANTLIGKKTQLPVFTHKIIFAKDALKKHQFYILNDEQSLTPITKTELINLVAEYCTQNDLPIPKNIFKHSVEFLRYAYDKEYLIRNIDYVLWKDDPGYCYNRLPWIKSEVINQPTPLWDELLSRIEINRDAFCDYIASMFYEKSYNQYYLWLSGGHGKTSILNIIQKIFGNLFSYCETPKKNASMMYWNAEHYKYRVLVFEDDTKRMCDMVQEGWFRSLTGGGISSVIQKYKNGVINFKHNYKFIICSDSMPKLENNVSNQRRIIFTSLNSLPDNIRLYNEYSDDLYKESGAFIAKIREKFEKKYQYMCKYDNVIKYDEIEKEDLVQL